MREKSRSKLLDISVELHAMMQSASQDAPGLSASEFATLDRVRKTAEKVIEKEGGQPEVKKWRSAGGVVVPSTSDLSKALLIHQSNGFGGWSWPKGRLDEGESKVDAAVREVFEETGVKAKLMGAEGTSYIGKGVGQFSVTDYYLMVRVGGFPKPNEEADKVAFFPWEVVLKLLTGNPRDTEIATKAMSMLGVAGA